MFHLRAAGAGTLLLTLLILASAVSAADSRTAEANRGLDYLRTVQQPDGGFGPLGQTLDAVFAVRAAGVHPDALNPGAPLGRFLENHTAEAAGSPGLAAKAILGARALERDPRSIAGVDLVAVVESAFDPGSGLYGEDPFTQSVAILGLACGDVAVPSAAAAALAAMALDDGGWGFGGASDPDSTAIAVQALLATGATAADPAVEAGLAYLRNTQLDDGGWGYGESNTSSTAYVVQALLAAGLDPADTAFVRPAGGPLDYLAGQQAADGSFAGFDPVVATTQVIPALVGRSFCAAPSTPLASVSDDGGGVGTAVVAGGAAVAIAAAMAVGAVIARRRR